MCNVFVCAKYQIITMSIILMKGYTNLILGGCYNYSAGHPPNQSKGINYHEGDRI